MRIALLSNVTVDLLAGMLKKNVDVYLSAGFDTWQQEILMPSSGLYSYNPEAIVVLLHANAYSDIWNDLSSGEQLIIDWCNALKAVISRLPHISIFVSSIDISTERCLFGSEIRLSQYFENYFIKRIEELHSEGAKVYVLPVKETITNIGRNNFFSPKMWYFGSMPYSMLGIQGLNELIIRYIGVTKGNHKKCLVVDLDNTLWGGVIGEDGVNGIVLSNNKEGARYKDTQKILKKMKNQGVMLAILSKNNVGDVEPVYSHPDMILKHEDFVAEIINWDPKCVNIRQMAKELNIGLDSFVFLDDNPAEREQMKAECPEVTVIDFPKDSSLLPDVVDKAYYDYFLSLEVTVEDTKKTAMYHAESLRKAEMSAASSVEEYLKRLEMTMIVHYMTPEEEARVTQLTNKTNQFNVTTKRYSEDDIHAYAIASDSDVITVRMADKYGDNGLVSVLILKYINQECMIDTFLMSCRVMGRNAEFEIMSLIKSMLISKGITKISGLYIKTEKNAPVDDLYDKLGFSLEEVNQDTKKYIANTIELPETTHVFSSVVSEL